MDAVGRKHFVVLVTRQQFVVVIFASVAVRFLDRASGRRIVTGDGKPYRRTVRKRNLILHQPLTERSATDDRSPVVILERAGQNLARRSAVLVDQNDQFLVHKLAVPFAVFDLPVPVTILRINDHFAFRKKLPRYQNRLVEQSPRIAAHVEDQFFHTLLLQPSDRFGQFFMSIHRELLELDIPRFGTDHVGGDDAFDRNGVAGHDERNQILYARPLDTERHLAAARPAQPFHDAVLRHLNAGHHGIVHRHDAVPGLYSGLGARPRVDHVQHDHRIGRHIENDPDPVEFPFDALLRPRQILSRQVRGMGIQLIEDQRNDPFGQRIDRNRVHVLRPDQRQQPIDLVAARSRQGGPPDDRTTRAKNQAAQKNPRHQRTGYDRRQNNGEFTVFIHTSNLFCIVPPMQKPFRHHLFLNVYATPNPNV